jgi:hypothetical protein
MMHDISARLNNSWVKMTACSPGFAESPDGYLNKEIN